MARRGRKRLGDIGPKTMRYQAIRDGIRGVRRALDRRSCQDAGALLRLTDQVAHNMPVARAEREYLDEERSRYRKICKR